MTFLDYKSGAAELKSLSCSTLAGSFYGKLVIAPDSQFCKHVFFGLQTLSFLARDFGNFLLNSSCITNQSILYSSEADMESGN